MIAGRVSQDILGLAEPPTVTTCALPMDVFSSSASLEALLVTFENELNDLSTDLAG